MREPVPPEYTRLSRALVQLGRLRRERLERQAEGQRITAWRAREGLSAGAAARRLGVLRRELYRMERGEKRAPVRVWGRIFERG